MNQDRPAPETMDIAWCPGCGNFGIRRVLNQALDELKIDRRNLVLVSGIGQAAKIPQYVECNYFNGLHGRALPAATAIKTVNPALTVIAESGDGCSYGEGGNHFIHAIRRNPDIAHLVHNNMVYGLTKGQASPTSQLGFQTPIQLHGVFDEPLNPIALAVALNASFVARGYIGDPAGTKELIKKAITHRGYALVDIFQPCVSYNHLNTYSWFKEHTYTLGPDHNPADRAAAFRRATETEKLPLGIFYLNPARQTISDRKEAGDNSPPLYLRQVDRRRLERVIASAGKLMKRGGGE